MDWILGSSRGVVFPINVAGVLVKKALFLSIASFKMRFREHKTRYFFISGSVVFFFM